MSASLLGTNIYEIEASWTGPEELKQANYTLQSLPKRFEIPQGGAHLGISQGHGVSRHP